MVNLGIPQLKPRTPSSRRTKAEFKEIKETNIAAERAKQWGKKAAEYLKQKRAERLKNPNKPLFGDGKRARPTGMLGGGAFGARDNGGDRVRRMLGFR